MNIPAYCILSALLSVLMGCTDSPPTHPPDDADSTNVNVDTTTHMYSWTQYEFGLEGGGSYLKCVSAIDDNSVYAVGYIAVQDTSDPSNWNIKNAVRWDGSKWYIEDIPHKRILPGGDSVVVGGNFLVGVWGEPPNNWTFATGGPLIYYDGTSAVTDLYFRSASNGATAFTLWGNEAKRWFGGGAGHLTFGEGRKYTHFPVPTQSSIDGIWGNDKEVWAVSGNSDHQHVALRYKIHTWHNMNDSIPSATQLSTEDVWCDRRGLDSGGTVIMVGAGISHYRKNSWHSVIDAKIPINHPYYFKCVHGTSENNIFAAGSYGKIIHFNGATWHYYKELAADNVTYLDIWATGNMVFCVGAKAGHALVTIGLRRR